MKFWCNNCEQDFEAESNSNIYEQANCPTCDRGCLTFETEYDDARSQIAQKKVVSSLLSIFLGMLSGGLGSATGAAASRSSTPAILEFATKINYRRPLIVTLATLHDARGALGELVERDVDCRITETAEGYCIHVDESDEQRARRIVEQWLLTRST